VPTFSSAVLQRERVEHRREHPHVVGCRPIHPGGRSLHAPIDVPRANHDRDLHALVVHVRHLPRHGGHALGVRAELERPHQGLTRELQQDAFEGGGHPRGAYSVGVAAEGRVRATPAEVRY